MGVVLVVIVLDSLFIGFIVAVLYGFLSFLIGLHMLIAKKKTQITQ